MATSHQIIPEHEQQCIWMDAGLVNYKLCDKNFECEGCPFDVTMRTQNKTFAERASEQQTPFAGSALRKTSNNAFDEVIEQLTEPLKTITLPTDRIYYSSHTWMQRMNDGSCRIGIDGFLAKLLNPVVGVAVVRAPMRLDRNDPYAWLIRDAETLALHNPVSGFVAETNSLLTSKPSLLTTDPYDSGWLIALQPSCADSNDSSEFYSPEEYQDVMQKDVVRISSLLGAAFKKNKNSVGTTMYDGGFRTDSIEQFIGEKRYITLLTRLISPR